jgi:hypothetical protein
MAVVASQMVHAGSPKWPTPAVAIRRQVVLVASLLPLH